MAASAKAMDGWTQEWMDGPQEYNLTCLTHSRDREIQGIQVVEFPFDCKTSSCHLENGSADSS
jgi:hypothetical protein